MYGKYSMRRVYLETNIKHKVKLSAVFALSTLTVNCNVFPAGLSHLLKVLLRAADYRV